MARVVLLQCELEHRHQSPHLAMCLYAADLSGLGHTVRCALVHPSALEDAGREFADRCDLLVLDSIFPFALVQRLRELVGAITIVGGHNALQHALRGPADIALVGPGREALRTLVRSYDEGVPLQGLPGTWFTREDGVVDCGPHLPAARMESELLPFQPFMDWDYFGPPRAPGSNLRIPSVVAEFGCVYNRGVLADGGFYADLEPRLPDLDLSPAAATVIQQHFVSQEGGCTFCSLRYTAHQAARPGTSQLLLGQVRTLLGMGARGLSLQSENPLPGLAGLLDSLAAEPQLSERCEELHIRTIPWLVTRHRSALEAAISRCRELGIRLILSQVGFEAFDELGLAVFHKGLGPADNRADARLLSELSERHGDTFTGCDGHGFILLHPWSTPESLRRNLRAARADAPWLLPAMLPDSRVELYCEWTPLFWKAWDDGLIDEAPARFGWDFHFADPQCSEVVAVTSSILADLGEQARGSGADILEAVLGCLAENPEPGPRRDAYLALRATLRAPTRG